VTTYRTGNHWGVTIVREGEHGGDCFDTCNGHPGAQLVAVVVNGDQALAERICALLNGEAEPCAHGRPGGKGCGPCSFDRAIPPSSPSSAPLSDLALRHAATRVRAARPGVEPQTALAVVRAMVAMGWRPSPGPLSAPVSASDAPGVPESGSDGSEGAEGRTRFEVRGAATYEDPQLVLECERCRWDATIDDPPTLAELNQRADEHTEVCR